MTKRDPYEYIQDEKAWREKVKASWPKAKVKGNGAGTLLALLPDVDYWKSKVGHFKVSGNLGGFVLRKGTKL